MSENVAIEEETHDLPIGVGIRDLRKVFKVLYDDLKWIFTDWLFPYDFLR